MMLLHKYWTYIINVSFNITNYRNYEFMSEILEAQWLNIFTKIALELSEYKYSNI